MYFQLPAYGFSLKSKHVAQNETHTNLVLVDGRYFPLLLLRVTPGVSWINTFYLLHALFDVRQTYTCVINQTYVQDMCQQSYLQCVNDMQVNTTPWYSNLFSETQHIHFAHFCCNDFIPLEKKSFDCSSNQVVTASLTSSLLENRLPRRNFFITRNRK